MTPASAVVKGGGAARAPVAAKLDLSIRAWRPEARLHCSWTSPSAYRRSIRRAGFAASSLLTTSSPLQRPRRRS